MIEKKRVNELNGENKLAWYNSEKGLVLQIYCDSKEAWSTVTIEVPSALYELQKDVNEQLDYRNKQLNKYNNEEW